MSEPKRILEPTGTPVVTIRKPRPVPKPGPKKRKAKESKSSP